MTRNADMYPHLKEDSTYAQRVVSLRQIQHRWGWLRGNATLGSPVSDSECRSLELFFNSLAVSGGDHRVGLLLSEKEIATVETALEQLWMHNFYDASPILCDALGKLLYAPHLHDIANVFTLSTAVKVIQDVVYNNYKATSTQALVLMVTTNRAALASAQTHPGLNVIDIVKVFEEYIKVFHMFRHSRQTLVEVANTALNALSHDCDDLEATSPLTLAGNKDQPCVLKIPAWMQGHKGVHMYLSCGVTLGSNFEDLQQQLTKLIRAVYGVSTCDPHALQACKLQDVRANCSRYLLHRTVQTLETAAAPMDPVNWESWSAAYAHHGLDVMQVFAMLRRPVVAGVSYTCEFTNMSRDAAFKYIQRCMAMFTDVSSEEAEAFARETVAMAVHYDDPVMAPMAPPKRKKNVTRDTVAAPPRRSKRARCSVDRFVP